MDSNLRSKSIVAFAWDFAGSIGLQLVSFIISIVLARLLSPEEFGLIGMVLVFTAVAQVFMDMGFGSAIVQSQEVKEGVYSSVFWLNIIIGVILSLSLFLAAKPIAAFYGNESLILITETLSIVFFISSLGVMQKIRYTKELNFKVQSLISIIANLLSGAIAIYLAFNDVGVMSLVYQRILYTFFDIISYWIISGWRPTFRFNLNDIKGIWGYSSKEFLDRIISTIYSKLDVIMIGKTFSSSTLGFYTRAFSLNMLISQFTTTSLGKIFFPLISKLQNDLVKVREVYERTIRIIAFLSIGLSGLFYLISEDLFLILYTEKWAESIWIFKYLVCVGFLYPISVLILSVISGLGFPGRVLVSGLYKKGINIFPIIIGFLFGIESFLISRICFGLVGFWVNCFYLKKTIGLGIVTQISYFVLPVIFAAITVFLLESLIQIENRYYSLLISAVLFGITFSISSILFDKKLKNILFKEYELLKKQLIK